MQKWSANVLTLKSPEANVLVFRKTLREHSRLTVDDSYPKSNCGFGYADGRLSDVGWVFLAQIDFGPVFLQFGDTGTQRTGPYW